MTTIETLSAAILTSMQALSRYQQAGDAERSSNEVDNLVTYLRDALQYDDDNLQELITYAVGLLPPERAKGLLESEMKKPSPFSRVAAMRVAAYALEPNVALQILQDHQYNSILNPEDTKARDFLVKEVIQDRAKAVKLNS